MVKKASNRIKNDRNQVALQKLVFTHNWEDPRSDHEALQIKPNDAIFAITSGGCNILGFLLYDPAVVYCVDINPAQSYLLELKIAAFKAFDHRQLLEFSGIRTCDNRLELFSMLKRYLSDEALAFWMGQQNLIKSGFIMNGKYERFIRIAGKLIRGLQGRKRVDALFKQKTAVEQAEFFDRVWNTRRFRWLFSILFNKHILARRGLVADYFQFDDGSKSFAESFYKRSKNAFRDLPVADNYFLSLYLRGKYFNEQEVPDYLKQENFDIIKSRLNRLRLTTGKAQQWLDAVDPRSIDCFSLSNICELMSEQETGKLFSAVERAARPGARIIFRNLIIPREVPVELSKRIVKDEKLSEILRKRDRSFVYGKVAAYLAN